MEGEGEMGIGRGMVRGTPRALGSMDKVASVSLTWEIKSRARVP